MRDRQNQGDIKPMLAISEEYKLSPEALTFTDTYLTTLDLDETCRTLEISSEVGQAFLRKKEVKRFIDNVYMETGYYNKLKIQDVLNNIVSEKLEEAAETGISTKYDLLDVIKMIQSIKESDHKMQETGPSKVQNIQNNNYGTNLGNLLDKISK